MNKQIKCGFKVLLISSVMFYAHTGFAGGKYAGSSMELGIGARPLALGGAAAAMYGSAELFHYNPASLTFVEKPTLSLMYAPSFQSITDPLANYNYAGIALPLPGGGTIALNWTRFSVDDIPIYPDPKGSSFAERNSDKNLQMDGVALGYFEDVEDVYYFSFAKAIKSTIPLGWLYMDMPFEIPFGMNFKMIRQKLYNAQATGMGIDIGTMIKLNLGHVFDKRNMGDLAFGVSSTDVNSTAIIWNTAAKTEDHIQRAVLYGLYYQQKLGFSDARVNLYWTRYKKYDVYSIYSAEFLIKGLAIRVGKNEFGITTGAGIQFWRLMVDYAFVSNQLDDVHRLSCAIRLKE
ncbi:MAG TPA: hypothetical protein PLP19_12390 [bacterium]|nr:hypothetical protein [bacterium]HPN44283.1 hypothetical protein [bacterium]